MIQEALDAVYEYRNDLNEGNIDKINAWISDDFIGYFGYYADKEFEIYRADSYKLDNIETIKGYEGKSPYWKYTDLTHNLRTDDEIIFSSIVEFYLQEEKVATALAMEVFKKESGGWKLFRQHMESYSK
ncbi:DUF4440 domain-containing protein [Fredinandcohnia sp. QZ13]|uniref:DUF4440 domain-containing protein n=1 Tax=Fredinandcohnia sp. QZ13 TaxID=3073144 RepID=UPI0028532477|nr:DUF4440 domain-containing protein [Fredinandcohnia sp. QZ13]MDR4889791.1 DUF4440 domain-containing protein [Fredinandcohnia sp. QZ13]